MGLFFLDTNTSTNYRSTQNMHMLRLSDSRISRQVS
jgi:hypothetical protein